MSLRRTVIAVVAAGVLLTFFLGITHGRYVTLVLCGYWSIALVVLLVERGRYRPHLSGTDYRPTNERFVDPVSGRMTTVYVDAATGRRDYRPEDAGH